MTSIKRLLEIMKALRDPQTGCPWDKKQDFQSIAPYTIEEAYEVADAINREDYAELKDELGDLLFQAVYHAQMADELGYFNFEDVVTAINTKMVVRHPHVFGDQNTSDEAAVKHNWEAQKAKERAGKKDTGVLAGVAMALPALARAAKLQKRAARVGFDWSTVDPVIEKVNEELSEIKQEMAGNNADKLMEEVGDLLFACVNLARHLKINPEHALFMANNKFTNRFEKIEAKLKAENKDINQCGLEELDRLWEQVKREE